MSIVAARARQSGFSLELLAGELDSAGRRLDFLDGGDSASQMRAAFSWSFAALTEPAARLFGALAARTGSRASAAMAADAADVSEQEARRLLGELTRASLLTEDGLDQYVCNDLLLQYAREASAS